MGVHVRARTTAAASLLLLVAAACGSAPPPPEGPPARSETPGSPPTTSVSPEPRPAEILNFEAANLAGGVIRGAEYAGKDVAFWFWAPW